MNETSTKIASENYYESILKKVALFHMCIKTRGLIKYPHSKNRIQNALIKEYLSDCHIKTCFSPFYLKRKALRPLIL